MVKEKQIIAIIPARYASTRFPGKPLVQINGKTLIQRTYENALRCAALDKIYIATDDERIFQHALSFNAPVIMTSLECANGTERINEALSKIDEDSDIIVNLQGDEPCTHPDTIEKIITGLQNDEEAVMSTAVSRITENITEPSIVKCVMDHTGRALYFSRSPIPYYRNVDSGPCYRHHGIYAFRHDFLPIYSSLPSTPLQMAEDLEQLKILEHGYKIQAVLVEDSSIGVDTPQDINKIERLLCSRSIYLSPEESSLPLEKD